MYLIILGPPGAGKGTVAEIIVGKEGLHQISTGDLLRSAVQEGSELGREAESYMNKGDLVPDEIIMGMVEEHITDEIIRAGFILDGFPRTISQAKSLDDLMVRLGIGLDLAALIEVDRVELIRRMQDRRTCSNPDCQTVYSVSYNPPQEEGICDNCGSEIVSRADQTGDVISNRLDVYEEKTSPLIQYYKDHGLLKRYSHEHSTVIADMIISDLKSA